MNRWNYLLPRIVILALIGLVVWLSIDPLLSRAFVYHAQAVTGAKVEVGSLRTSLEEGKVFLQDLQIADPRDTDSNLLQADMAYLDVDLRSLLNRRIRITDGRTSELRFGSPRTSSGRLPETVANDSTQNIEPVTEFDLNPHLSAAVDTLSVSNDPTSDIESTEAAWLDQLQSQITPQSQTSLKTIAAANQLSQAWPARFNSAQQNLLALNQELTEIRDSLDLHNTNPLRQDYETTLNNVSSLLQRATELQTQLATLQNQAQDDFAVLAQVERTDLAALSDTAAAPSFDGSAMTQLLLARSQQNRVDEIVDWFRWFRDAVPDYQTDLQTQPTRGINVILSDTQPPDFLIEQLEIEGAGHFANQHLNFAGQVKNLASQPHRHTEPTSFDLRAQGKQHFVVKCTVDRRTDTPTDTLEVNCPDLLVDDGKLGSDQTMLLTVGSGLKLQADIRLKAIGDQLAGELIFRHSNVSLHVDQLHELAGGTDVAVRLNHELSSCDQFETRVSVSGTMDQYQLQLHSDLGQQVAESMNRVTKDLLQQRLAARQQNFQASTQTQLQNLTNQVNASLQQLATDLTTTQQSIEVTRQEISAIAQRTRASIR